MFTKNSGTNRTINDYTRDELIYATGFQKGVTKEHNKNVFGFVLFAISNIYVIAKAYSIGKSVGAKLAEENKTTENVVVNNINKTEDKE